MRVMISFLLAFTMTSYAMGLSVNRSIVVDSGEKSGCCNSVNGSITVEDDAVIHGTCRTVNGQIQIKENCIVKTLQSVNGSVTVGEQTKVNGDIETVNGSVSCDKEVRVKGDIHTVNGGVTLMATTVEHDITTHNGDITLEENSVVLKDIIIKDSHNTFNKHTSIEIRLVDSTVQGDIVNRDNQKIVTVRLIGKSRVNGEYHNIDRVER